MKKWYYAKNWYYVTFVRYHYDPYGGLCEMGCYEPDETGEHYYCESNKLIATLRRLMSAELANAQKDSSSFLKHVRVEGLAVKNGVGELIGRPDLEKKLADLQAKMDRFYKSL